MHTTISILLLLVSLSQISLCQWELLSFPGKTPYTLLQTSQGLLAANTRTIYRSTDDGKSWDSLSTINPIAISKMIQVGNVLLANTSRLVIWPKQIASVFRSTNFGQSWDSVMAAVYGGESIAFSNTKVYVTLDGNLYMSPDTGKTWAKAITDSTIPGPVSGIFSSDNSLYLSLQSGDFFQSADGGLTWQKVQPALFKPPFNVTVQGSSFYAGSVNGGFIFSTDYGTTWRDGSAGLPDSVGFRALYVKQNTLIASLSKNFQQSVYRFQLPEGLWHEFNQGFSLARTGYIYSFASNSAYIFLASDSAIWRRPLSQWITGVKSLENQSTSNSMFLQNFPNPFNSSTTIFFTVNAPDYVSLKIYDHLGRDVASLYSGRVNSGTLKAQWNAANVSSGLYFVRLVSGQHSLTRKMLFLK